MNISCKGISKDFASKSGTSHVLKDISVNIQEEDFVCILGPNGCGKTTLLKIIAGILKPSSGNINYSGGNGSLSAISLIFQEHGLFPWLNVRDNICFGLEMQGLPRLQRYKTAEGYIEKMGLSRFLDYYPYQLSAGMKQKANLIRGLLMDTEVLLIDEPDSFLDISSRLAIQNDIYRIWKECKKTIVYITHDIEVALQLAKQVWIMSKSPARIIKKFDISSCRALTSKENIKVQLLEVRDKIIDIIGQEAKLNQDGK